MEHSPGSESFIRVIRGDKIYYFEPKPASDHIVSTIRREQDFYEAPFLDWLGTLNLPDGLCIDVGACIGNHSIYFGGPLGRDVLAFEPNPKAFEILTANIRLNALEDRITPFSYAIGAEATEAQLVEGLEDNLGAASLKQMSTGDIRVVTLDEILPPEAAVALIKIDVEGWELKVLKGAKRCLETARPLVAAEAMTSDAMRANTAFLSALDYAPVSVMGATALVLYCHRSQLDSVFWGQSPSFWTLYANRDLKLTQYLIARQSAGSAARLERAIESVSKLTKASQETQLTAKGFEEFLNKKLITFNEQQSNSLQATERQFIADISALGRNLQMQFETYSEKMQTSLLDELNALKALQEHHLRVTQEVAQEREDLQREKLLADCRKELEAHYQTLFNEQKKNHQTEIIQLQSKMQSDAEHQASLLHQEYDKKIDALLHQQEQGFMTRLKDQRSQLRAEFILEKTRLEHAGAEQAKLLRDERTNIEEKLTKQLQTTRNALRSAQNQVRTLEQSLRYQLGDAIALAIKIPGRHSLNLPKKLFQVITKSFAVKRDAINPSVDFEPVVEEDQSLTPSLRARPYPKPLELPESLAELRVAVIMDQFSYLSYSPECRLLQVTPKGWRQELEAFSPHLLFIESAWRGIDDLWENQVPRSPQPLLQMIEWCRERNIPTAFWNKEDPVHFETFLGVSHLFDYIFTTDIDCVRHYKAKLCHDQIYFLPFACQPQLHNPTEKFDRKQRFSFAGAYYARYPERQADFCSHVDALSNISGVDIFDRNFGKDDPNYQFPNEYRQLILGNLPFDQIDIAYKGYRFAINMNSIKQSQSMFARRIYELLASNTVVVSNYSRGLRLLFGDLCIVTDEPKELERRLQPLLEDESYYRKFRLLGLRRALAEHTYKHRLQFVVDQIFPKHFEKRLPRVLMAAWISSPKDVGIVVGHFERQSYAHAKLALVPTNEVTVEAASLPEGVEIWDLQRFTNSPGDLRDYDYVAGICAEDYYGPHYLTDLLQATQYSDAPCIGKSAYYYRHGDDYRLVDDGCQYQQVAALAYRQSLLNTKVFVDLAPIDWVSNLAEGKFDASDCFSIDEFNYCRGGEAQSSIIVDDLSNVASGLALENFHIAAECVEASEVSDNLRFWDSRKLGELFLKRANVDALKLHASSSALQIESSLEEGKHQYIYAQSAFDLKELVNPDGSIPFHLECHSKFDLRVALVFLDKNKQKLDSYVGIANRNERVEVPNGALFAHLGLRISGQGQGSVTRLYWGHVDRRPGLTLTESPILVLTNHYAKYDDLYRYGFLHSRLQAYQDAGLKTPVFRFNSSYPPGYHEFQGVDVITGYKDELHELLMSGRVKKVLTHFLDATMWEVLRHYIDRIQVIVWVHGAEIQPASRRAFNYTTLHDKLVAERDSKVRVEFWRKLFRQPHPNLHLVFVSDYFAKEVFEDIGLELPPSHFSIIHNYIDHETFPYHPKHPDQRKKILSIRPYASLKYANDLSVKAVLELSKEPFFNELEFCFVGDGQLFDETLAALRGFSNVTIERRFLTQSEIASKHQDFGVFLSPTRMDSQGVSRDEAMSSGLVPITNAVTAIPEFVSDDCGILVPGDDYVGIAEGIRELYRNKSLFAALSEGAARRVRSQSGYAQTIAQELNLILQQHT